MAEDNADINLDENAGDSSSSAKSKNKLGGLIPGMLKWILIAVGAVILIVVVVFITIKLVNNNSSSQPTIQMSEEYKEQREILDWYTSLGVIRTKTSDDIPASVVVNIALGYKKDDKATATEITARKIELTDFLRRYFTEKTIAELKPQNEEKLKIELRNAINDEILSNSKIRDVSFQQLDVVEQ
ncbi:MAG: flagellar basal body-associated FliL family protein [Treponema sp.]